MVNGPRNTRLHQPLAPVYKLGCNFDSALIDGVSSLNIAIADGIIAEFYGSIRTHAWLTARPAFRLPELTLSELAEYIARCTTNGIRFNYTLNSPYIGSKREIDSRRAEIEDTVRAVIDCGVTTITVATPLMAEIVRKISTSIGLNVSTIAHIDTVTQIKAWKDHYDVNCVCGNLLKNRSVRFLKNAAAFCNKNGIAYELLVNEFCGVGLGGTSSGATHCIYRDSCYIYHGENETVEDDLLLQQYPMSRCISSRAKPEAWIKLFFIRPEDIYRYLSIGISHYKITGRTGTTGYLLSVAKAYMLRQWQGNLLHLWKNLETITSGCDEFEFVPTVNIDNPKLDALLDWWFDKPSRECANELCGETCKYCDKFFPI